MASRRRLSSTVIETLCASRWFTTSDLTSRNSWVPSPFAQSAQCSLTAGRIPRQSISFFHLHRSPGPGGNVVAGRRERRPGGAKPCAVAWHVPWKGSESNMLPTVLPSVAPAAARRLLTLLVIPFLAVASCGGSAPRSVTPGGNAGAGGSVIAPGGGSGGAPGASGGHVRGVGTGGAGVGHAGDAAASSGGATGGDDAGEDSVATGNDVPVAGNDLAGTTGVFCPAG